MLQCNRAADAGNDRRRDVVAACVSGAFCSLRRLNWGWSLEGVAHRRDRTGRIGHPGRARIRGPLVNCIQWDADPQHGPP